MSEKPIGSWLQGEMPEAPYLGGSVVGGDQGTWAPDLWQCLLDTETVKSMIDIGCGTGHTVAWFHNKGVLATGIDGYFPGLASSPIPERIVVHDYTKGPYPTVEYDLAWSGEFLEHVEEKYWSNIAATLQRAHLVMFTHAVPGQGGHHHVNCQSSSYWIQKLEALGFTYDSAWAEFLKKKAPKAYYVVATLLCFRKGTHVPTTPTECNDVPG